MNEPFLEVVKPGVQTTVQDSGRPGHLGKGIPPAGAQDSYALRAANLLVGNPPGPPPLSLGAPGAAGLEMVMQGPRLIASEACTIAVTGAEMSVKVDGEPAERWTAIELRAGDRVDIGPARRGVRGYLAVSGGITTPPFLGSRATHLLGGVGGHEGRALRAGDRVPLGTPERDTAPVAPSGLERPLGEAPYVVRVVRGPQDELFEPESVDAFLTATWEVTPQTNRMGSRLLGPRLQFRPRPDYLSRDAGSNPSNIVDDITPLGGIQAPDGAALIVMGVDHPTAGGYAKLATVITPDLGIVGQARPGETVRFEAVDPDEALRLAAAVEAPFAPVAEGVR